MNVLNVKKYSIAFNRYIPFLYSWSAVFAMWDNLDGLIAKLYCSWFLEKIAAYREQKRDLFVRYDLLPSRSPQIQIFFHFIGWIFYDLVDNIIWTISLSSHIIWTIWYLLYDIIWAIFCPLRHLKCSPVLFSSYADEWKKTSYGMKPTNSQLKTSLLGS